jgi:glyoxylase-like metal-dependent hydrolase (beta-lactamase superfamily II)
VAGSFGSEVLPGVHRIEAPLGDRVVCMYLLVGEKASLLVDTGLATMPDEVIVPYLGSIFLSASSLRYVLSTHSDVDHIGGNAAMRHHAPNAIFMCHVSDKAEIEDAEKMIRERYGEFRTPHHLGESEASEAWLRDNARPTPIDLGLVGRESIFLDKATQYEVIHTPGHAKGHLALYNRVRKVAIVADAVLGSMIPTTQGVSAVPPTYRYVDDYLQTINTLRTLPIETMLTSHYPVMTGSQAEDFLDESFYFVERVELTLREHLKSSARGFTMKQLVDDLGSHLGDWPKDMSYYTIYPLQGHLEKFVAQKLVRVEENPNQPQTFIWQG